MIFLDESGAKTNLTRLRGRPPKGQRVHGHSPQGHWNTTTILGSIRLDGSSLCMAAEGAADTEVFQAYVRRVLCPKLRPGDIVVLDNLSLHKSQPTLELIRQAGAQILFLPAYSPDLNPIEKMWSKVKNYLRSAEARTEAALIQGIAAALQTIHTHVGSWKEIRRPNVERFSAVPSPVSSFWIWNARFTDSVLTV